MGKKPHPADLAAAEDIKRAASFSVFLHRFQARIMEDGFATLAEAEARAEQLQRDNPTKRCLIYGIVDGAAVLVPSDLRAAASAQTKEGPTMITKALNATPNATRANQAAKKTPKKAAPAIADEEPKARRGRHADELEAALKGKLPAAPDFTSPSRSRYRTRLKAITDLVRQKDIAGLKALAINPVDSANKIMARYRDHAVVALEAKVAG